MSRPKYSMQSDKGLDDETVVLGTLKRELVELALGCELSGITASKLCKRLWRCMT